MKAIPFLAVVVAMHASAPLAQTYPDRPVRAVVPFQAGTTIDVLCRVTVQKLSDSLGQQFIVENRVGATGHIAGEFVARSKPDGHTLLCSGSSTIVVSPHIMANLPYSPIRDLMPISVLAFAGYVLAANPEVPAGNIRELIAHLKANPGKLSYASVGIGTNQHLAMEMFKQMAGVDAVHIPYSTSPPATDLMAGRVQLMIDSIAVTLPNIRAGKLKALAIASPDRVPELPGLATVSETLPGFSVVGWGGYFAPLGTPRPVLQRLNAELARAVAAADVRATFAKTGFVAKGDSLEQTENFVRADSERWGKVVRDGNIKTQ